MKGSYFVVWVAMTEEAVGILMVSMPQLLEQCCRAILVEEFQAL